MKNKTKASLITWAIAALIMAVWSVRLAMTGVSEGNSEIVTFVLSLLASIGVGVAGAGFMQQWMIAKKGGRNV